MTKIEWTERSDWNPIRGCTRVSPGCEHCYSEAIAARFSGPGKPFEGFAEMTAHGPRWTRKVALIEERLMLPLKWKKPSRIFVNSASDLFHEAVTDEQILRVLDVVRATSHDGGAACGRIRHKSGREGEHTYQLLTKRSARMRQFINRLDWDGEKLVLKDREKGRVILRNLWLGVSAEDQRRADERIPDLLATPAAVRFVSCEPLLGPINLNKIRLWSAKPSYCADPQLQDCDFVFFMDAPRGVSNGSIPALNWVICGGESGSGARPMHPDWPRSLKDQCVAAGVPFFFKQWGSWTPHSPQAGGDLGGDVRAGRVMIVHPSAQSDTEVFRATGGRSTIPGSRYMERVGKSRAGRLLNGRIWDQMPEARP